MPSSTLSRVCHTIELMELRTLGATATLPRKAKSVPQNWILIILTTTEALRSKETSVVVAANVYKTSYRLQVAKACRQAMAVTRSIAGSTGSS